MGEPWLPRSRGAMKASLGVLAVLLVCQAVFPISGIRDKRRAGDASEEDERRLGGPGIPLVMTNGRLREGALEDGHTVPVTGAAASTPPLMNKTKRLREGNAHHSSSPPKVLDTVDLATEDGFLWQPISMSTPECQPDEEHCETIVRFCRINVGEYQENPWKYPMSVMLQKKSECFKAQNARAYHLSTLRAYRNAHPDEFLQPSGFVYHETRTGSTLVANMLAHVPSNLVVSENSLAEDPVRRCRQCTPEQRLGLLRDILPLIGTAKAGHTHLFFKFQDSTTLSVMTKAFPEVSWVFLFRDPVEVMVSNLKGAYGKRNRFYEDGFDWDAADNSTANHEVEKPSSKNARPMLSPCLLSANPAMRGKAREETCAARLKTLCQAAVTELAAEPEESRRGAVVEYTKLPDAVTRFMYPDLFGMGQDMLEKHLPYLSEAARMYSKSMTNPESKFEVGTDAGYKHVMAEKAYSEAAESTGLTGVYKELQELQTWHKRRTP